MSILKFTSKFNSVVSNKEQNVFYSPLSIVTALSMCLAGAKNETKRVLSQLLEAPENEDLKNFFEFLSLTPSKEYELTSSNAIWVQKGLELNSSYKDVIQNTFHSVIENVDFEKAKSSAVEKINNWCKESTNGKIPSILDDVQDDTIMILTNAIYFLGKWQTQFDPDFTKKKDFTNSSGTKEVSMMSISSDFSYFEDDEIQSVEIPYQGGLSMVVVLPKNDMKYVDENIEKIYEQSVGRSCKTLKVNLSIPKFKMETEYKLRDTFESMGTGLLFSDNAEFTEIVENEQLKISQIIHKAFVECDEKGTEAAAVTAVMMMRCAAMIREPDPKEFNANHPFVFFIKDNSNRILFFGKVVNP